MDTAKALLVHPDKLVPVEEDRGLPGRDQGEIVQRGEKSEVH